MDTGTEGLEDVGELQEGLEAGQDAGDAEETSGASDEEGDESGQEYGAESEEEDEDEGRHVKGRASGRIQRLVEENKAYKDSLTNLHSELEALRNGFSQLSESKEAEQLQYLSPEERFQRELDNRFKSLEAQLKMSEMRSIEAADKAYFNNLASNNVMAARLAQKVEEHVAEAKRRGFTGAKREDAFFYLLGKETASKAVKAVSKAKKQGEANIRKHTAKPAAAARSSATSAKADDYTDWRDYEARLLGG